MDNSQSVVGSQLGGEEWGLVKRLQIKKDDIVEHQVQP